MNYGTPLTPYVDNITIIYINCLTVSVIVDYDFEFRFI